LSNLPRYYQATVKVSYTIVLKCGCEFKESKDLILGFCVLVKAPILAVLHAVHMMAETV